MKGVMDECTHMANFSGEFHVCKRAERFSPDKPVTDFYMTPNYCRKMKLTKGAAT